VADWLGLDKRPGTFLPVVRSYEGGFYSVPLSAPFGSAPGAELVLTHCQQNHVWQESDDVVWAVAWDGLYRSTDGGATFAIQYTFPTPHVGADDRLFHGGLYFVYDSGTSETFLAGWFKDNFNIMTGWRYRLSDGATATAAGDLVSNNVDQTGSEYQFGNSIFTITDDINIRLFDPINLSWATYANPGGINGALSCDFAVGPDGNLYHVNWHSNSGLGVRLLRFTGAWADLGSYGTAEPGGFNNRATNRIGVFSDGTDLYAFYFDENAGTLGWRITRIPVPYDLTGTSQVGIATLPASLRSSADGGTASSGGLKRVRIVQDTESTPGTLRTFICFSEDSSTGTPWQVYEWQGPTTQMTFVGSGGAVGNALPSGSFAGGGRFYTPDQDGVRILDVSPTTGGEEVTYRVTGGGTRTVRFRRSANQQGTTAQATLTGPVTGGGTLGTNEVTGVPADGSLQTVVWNLFADGFSPGQGGTVLVPEAQA
jgi:hypothetical protein